MKIYIVTFVHTTNIGAALQMTALYKWLEKEGHSVEVLNYVPGVFLKNQRLLNCTDIVQLCKSIILLPVNLRKKLNYEKYIRNNVKLTKKCKNVSDICNIKQPDVYIAGSDQIWNDAFTNWDDGYFLNFPTTAKKISYAASYGKDIISTSEIQKMIEKTSSLQHISVREIVLQDAFEKSGREDVELVLDPVFLLDSRFCEENRKQIVKGKYVLIYEMERNMQCHLVAQKIARQIGGKIIQINKAKRPKNVDMIFSNVSPKTFLALMQNAEFIVTNSFHGTAVSIALKKQFYSIKTRELNSRIESVLKVLDLSERMIEDVSELKEGISMINYEEKKGLIDKKVLESKKYLKYALIN